MRTDDTVDSAVQGGLFSIEFFLNDFHWIRWIQWIKTKSKSSTWLPEDTLISDNRYIPRCSSKKDISIICLLEWYLFTVVSHNGISNQR